MADTDIRQTRTTDLASTQSDFSVSSENIDGPSTTGETYWDSPDWSKWLGYYKAIPELMQAIKALAVWTAGKGWTAEDDETTILLESMTGRGNDTFQSIIENMIIVKKINGDSFAEIIRNDKGKIVNLKPLSPSNIRVVTSSKGIILRYEKLNQTKDKILKITQVLHFSNDRIADEIHGVSVVESCEQVILARNEAITDWKKVLHRNINPLKIFEVDADTDTKLNKIKTEYQQMTKDYDALIIPIGNMKVTIPNVPLQNPTEWIRYEENFFYQAVGTPKIILGGSQEYTEASSKVGYLTFEQIYMREQREVEADIWNQIAKRVKFERPVSLKDNVQSDEAANTGQTAIQPNDTQAEAGA